MSSRESTLSLRLESWARSIGVFRERWSPVEDVVWREDVRIMGTWISRVPRALVHTPFLETSRSSISAYKDLVARYRTVVDVETWR